VANTEKAQIRRRPEINKKVIIERAGGKCAFPGCGCELIISGSFIGELCHIEAVANGGPRFNPDIMIDKLTSHDNLILLCPTHHRLIDAQPEIYTKEWLQKIKLGHEIEIKENGKESKEITIEQTIATSLENALKIWNSNQNNGYEEFWQKLFDNNPGIISQAVPNSIIKIGQKCYLGGKDFTNQGGNIVDFLYATRQNQNVIIVEIKTPLTKLIGKQYRTNAYSLTEDFSGAIVQVLSYKDELLKNYNSIAVKDGDFLFTAFNPKCLIIAGNLNIECLNSIQRKSFDLFRANCFGVDIITYDELFNKLKDLIDLIK